MNLPSSTSKLDVHGLILLQVCGELRCLCFRMEQGEDPLNLLKGKGFITISEYDALTQFKGSVFTDHSARGKKKKLYFSWNYRKFWLNWVIPLLILQLLKTCRTTSFWRYIGFLHSYFVTSAWKRHGFLEQGGLERWCEQSWWSGWRLKLGYSRAAIQLHSAQHKWTNACRPLLHPVSFGLGFCILLCRLLCRTAALTDLCC